MDYSEAILAILVAWYVMRGFGVFYGARRIGVQVEDSVVALIAISVLAGLFWPVLVGYMEIYGFADS